MKKFLLLLLSIALVLSCCSCNSGNVEMPTDEIIEEEPNGTYISLQMREADTLDPLLTQRQSVRDALLTVYEPLFNINSTFGLEPVLAQSYAFNENATIMTLKIKEGVLWHNGQPFTSDDVVYTVNKIKENPNSSYYLNLESVDRVEKQSSYEVVFYLNKSDALLIYSLYFPIERANLDINDIPIGTGAYMFESGDGKSMNLVKNPNWHMGQAVCDGVKFLYMRTGAMAQEAFSSGKIHAVTKEMLDIENFAIKESNTKHLYPDGMFEFIGFNSTSGIFTDPLLRIAASNAIDRNSLGKIFGDAVASGFPIMFGSSGFSPSYETTEYNLDYAKEVIFSAGWTDLDYDSKPEKIIDNSVRELSFTLLVADRDNLRVDAANEVKAQLEMAGFNVNVEVRDIETYNQRVSDGEYDAFLGAVYYDKPYDVYDLLASGGNVNYQCYDSPDMDLIISNFVAATDVDKASIAFSELQALYNAQQPIAGIVFRTNYVVTSSYIEGEVNPYPYSPYANIAKWTLTSGSLTMEEE